MPASIKIIRGRDFIESSSEGDIDLEKSKQILLDVLQQSVSPPDFNILIDLRRSIWKLGATDVFQLVNEIKKNDELYMDRIALLVLPDTDKKTTELFDIFSRQSGLSAQIFTNYEDAVQWFFEK